MNENEYEGRNRGITWKSGGISWKNEGKRWKPKDQIRTRKGRKQEGTGRTKGRKR